MPPKGYKPYRTPEEQALRFEQGRAEAEARRKVSAEYYKLHGEREVHSTPGFEERQAAREAYLAGQITAEEATAIPGVTVGSDALYQVTKGTAPAKISFQDLWPEPTADNPPGGLTPEQTQIWQDWGASGQSYLDFPGWSYFSDLATEPTTSGNGAAGAGTISGIGGVLAVGVGLVLLMSFIK